jgi:hypothetical protein
MSSYEYREDSGYSETLTATTPGEASDQARELLRTGDYGPVLATLRLHARVTEMDGASELDHWRVTAAIDPPVPPCTGMDHKWDAGNSGAIPGGVIITSECGTCGLRQVRNTAGSCHDCGETYESITYETAEARR